MLYTYRAKCINVVDGDTFDVIVDLGFHLSKRIRVRLSKVDTPEIRAATEAERRHAREAKAFVERLMLDRDVTIRTHKDVGIYGRYTAEVILAGNEDLGDKLQEAGLLKREDYG
jgi:micrococcal nuclease